MDYTDYPAREFKMSASKQPEKSVGTSAFRYTCLNLNDMIELKPYYLSAEGVHQYMLKNIKKYAKKNRSKAIFSSGKQSQKTQPFLLKALLHNK